MTRQRLLLACQSTWISNENSNHPPNNHMRSHSYKLNFKRPDTFICLMRSLFRDKKILPKIPKNEKNNDESSFSIKQISLNQLPL